VHYQKKRIAHKTQTKTDQTDEELTPPRKTYPSASRQSARLNQTQELEETTIAEEAATVHLPDSDHEDFEKDPDQTKNKPVSSVDDDERDRPIESIETLDLTKTNPETHENDRLQLTTMSDESTLADLMKEMQAMKRDVASLREENAELRARARDSADGIDTRERNRREQSTAFGSSSGGPAATSFEPIGKAAWPAFKKFTGEDGEDRRYNDKSKTRTKKQAKFGGDKAEFHPFLIRLRDKFVEDEATFRNEVSRMAYLYSLLEAKAMCAVEARYASDTRPFTCVAEMIQVLEPAFGNPNEFTEANDALCKHIYDLNSIGSTVKRLYTDCIRLIFKVT
jgi:hypothetical protein